MHAANQKRYMEYFSDKGSGRSGNLTNRSTMSSLTIPSSAGSDSPAPSMRPPSHYHSYTGDVWMQDIFVEKIEEQRRKGQKFRVLFPGSDRFELERLDMWNHDSICTPCLILQPKTRAEVSSCVRGYTAGVRKCLSENRKKGSNMGIPRLCVAGGRNSFVSMKEGAIVLDLSRMRQVAVDAEARTVTVQGGAKVLDLDLELGRYGLMCVSGTHQNLGVVGCILGGGVGYASRKHGLAADNLISAEIVLADGRIKTCSSTKHDDLYWSIRGGGGGIGVITAVTLKCYPLRNAALLTFNLYAPNSRFRRKILEEWSSWIQGEVDDGRTVDTNYNFGAPREVYSQIILPANSSSLPCITTSVDPEVIPQSEYQLEQYREIMKIKAKRRSLFRNSSNSDDHRLPICWSRVPGLADLRSNKFGAPVRSNSTFRMVRYYDELQGLSNKYLHPGNLFIASKYASTLTSRIIAILVEATSGKKSPSNESRIFVTSAGHGISEASDEETAFSFRDMNFVIFIEGKWSETGSENRDNREKQKVIKWVHWVANQLNFCEGIYSTAHPESARDQVSKSGRSDPPSGWYNFNRENGSRLSKIKQKRDPRNVFSLASRVSWANKKAIAKQLSSRSMGTVKEGVVSADDCFVTKTTTTTTMSAPHTREGGYDSNEDTSGNQLLDASMEADTADDASQEQSDEKNLSEADKDDTSLGEPENHDDKQLQQELPECRPSPCGVDEELEEWSLAPIETPGYDENECIEDMVAPIDSQGSMEELFSTHSDNADSDCVENSEHDII